jgi:hypothetical protein
VSETLLQPRLAPGGEAGEGDSMAIPLDPDPAEPFVERDRPQRAP